MITIPAVIPAHTFCVMKFQSSLMRADVKTAHENAKQAMDKGMNE